MRGQCRHIECPYERIVAHFGEPNDINHADADRTKAQWSIETPHGKCCVYDYKQYDLEVEEIVEWSVNDGSEAAHIWVIATLEPDWIITQLP